MHGGKRYESSALISALLSVSTSRSGGHTRAPWNTASGPRPEASGARPTATGPPRGRPTRCSTASGGQAGVEVAPRARVPPGGWSGGGILELSSAVTLTRIFFFFFPLLFLAGAGRSECFSTWVKPGARKGMCLDSSLLFVVAAGLPSILPPTHRLSTPPQLFSSGKKNLVFTPAARVRLQPGERIQGCGAAGRRRALLLTRCNSRQQTLS